MRVRTLAYTTSVKPTHYSICIKTSKDYKKKAVILHPRRRNPYHPRCNGINKGGLGSTPGLYLTIF
jgi:hypothetical protein